MSLGGHYSVQSTKEMQLYKTPRRPLHCHHTGKNYKACVPGPVLQKSVKFWGPDARKGSSHHGSVETNLTSTHEDVGSIPELTSWVKDSVLRIELWYRLQMQSAPCCATAGAPERDGIWKESLQM